MRDGLLGRLRCPRCHAECSLELQGARREMGEIRAARLRCRVCGEDRVVERGIVDLLPPDVPDFVAAEAAGLDRFVDTMRAQGWTREDVLELPHRQEGYRHAQATAMEQTLANERLGLRGGDQLLDVGANTCWASAMFAQRGLDVTALDINANEFQGLASADWWFEASTLPLKPETPAALAWWWAVVHTVRRVAPLRRAALAYKHYDGSAAFHMIATKPVRP